MTWLWSLILIAGGVAGCLGIYREMVEQDAHKASIRRSRSAVLEAELREAHAAEYIVDTIKRFHLRENRAELTALWDDQYALAMGFHNGDFANWYVDRMWHRNREHWGFVIAAKGRIEPDEMSA